MSTETIVPRADALTFRAPEGLITRGTVVVIPGRGESPASYRDAVSGAEARPLVVVGSDLGAVASVLVRRKVLVADALVLAALPQAAGTEATFRIWC